MLVTMVKRNGIILFCVGDCTSAIKIYEEIGRHLSNEEGMKKEIMKTYKDTLAKNVSFLKRKQQKSKTPLKRKRQFSNVSRTARATKWAGKRRCLK